MQERYLGDIHDFYKFLFLKYLSKKLKKKIGLNWYLVDPKQVGIGEEKKKDGEKRNYLKNDDICKLDLKISKEFEKIVNIKDRNIKNFTYQTHLNNYIKFFNEKIPHINRELWLRKSLKFFRNNDIIFLDPDNGLLKRKESRNSLKHLLIDELLKYFCEKKIVIFTQFQSYNKNHLIYLEEIKKFLIYHNLGVSLPIIRNRTAPNTFFFTIGDNDAIKKKKIYNLYKIYEKKMKTNVELITI